MIAGNIGFTIRRDQLLPTARNESESRTKVVYVRQRGTFVLTYFEHPSLEPTNYGAMVPGYDWNAATDSWIKIMHQLPQEWAE